MTRLLEADDRRAVRRQMGATTLATNSMCAGDTLDTALQRGRAKQRQALITRREMRRRSEVPIGQAGTAFDEAMYRELEPWYNLAVDNEVP